MRKRRNQKDGVKPSAATLLLASIDGKLDKYGPSAILRLNAAQMERDEYKRQLEFLKAKLAGLLSPDQVEAAKICGCRPEMYAIEVIDMYKEKFFPHFDSEITNLRLGGIQGQDWKR